MVDIKGIDENFSLIHAEFDQYSDGISNLIKDELKEICYILKSSYYSQLCQSEIYKQVIEST
jgi:hypothetical protein